MLAVFCAAPQITERLETSLEWDSGETLMSHLDPDLHDHECRGWGEAWKQVLFSYNINKKYLISLNKIQEFHCNENYSYKVTWLKNILLYLSSQANITDAAPFSSVAFSIRETEKQTRSI